MIFHKTRLHTPQFTSVALSLTVALFAIQSMPACSATGGTDPKEWSSFNPQLYGNMASLVPQPGKGIPAGRERYPARPLFPYDPAKNGIIFDSNNRPLVIFAHQGTPLQLGRRIIAAPIRGQAQQVVIERGVRCTVYGTTDYTPVKYHGKTEGCFVNPDVLISPDGKKENGRYDPNRVFFEYPAVPSEISSGKIPVGIGFPRLVYLRPGETLFIRGQRYTLASSLVSVEDSNRVKHRVFIEPLPLALVQPGKIEGLKVHDSEPVTGSVGSGTGGSGTGGSTGGSSSTGGSGSSSAGGSGTGGSTGGSSGTGGSGSGTGGSTGSSSGTGGSGSSGTGGSGSSSASGSGSGTGGSTGSSSGTGGSGSSGTGGSGSSSTGGSGSSSTGGSGSSSVSGSSSAIGSGSSSASVSSNAGGSASSAVSTIWTPNDPLFPKQGNLKLNKVPEAWKLSKGDGIGLAILDTACDAGNSELQNRIVESHDSTGNKGGYSNIHGTEMAIVAAGASDNKQGTASPAHKAKLYSVNVCDKDGMVRESSIIEALFWCGNKGIKVANLSIDGLFNGTTSAPLEDAVKWYHDSKGGIIVARDSHLVRSPCNPGGGLDVIFKRVVSISAVTTVKPDSWDGSNCWCPYIGNRTWFAMPWKNIYVGNQGIRSGIAFPVAQASGIIAQVWGTNPGRKNTVVEAALASTAQKIVASSYYKFSVPAGGSSATWSNQLGFGSLNAEEACNKLK